MIKSDDRGRPDYTLHVNDRVDDPLEVGITAGYDPADHVAWPGDGMGLQDLSDPGQPQHNWIMAASLPELQGHERGDGKVNSSRIYVRSVAFDDAACVHSVKPGLDCATGHAEASRCFQHPHARLCGQQLDQASVELVDHVDRPRYNLYNGSTSNRN